MAEYRIDVTTDGSAGSATGSGRTAIPVKGFVYGVRVTYHASAPATTTVDLDEQGGLGQQILNLPANNSDTVLYPRAEESDNGSTPLGTYGLYYVDGRYLQASVAASDPLTNAVTLTLLTVD